MFGKILSHVFIKLDNINCLDYSLLWMFNSWWKSMRLMIIEWHWCVVPKRHVVIVDNLVPLWLKGDPVEIMAEIIIIIIIKYKNYTENFQWVAKKDVENRSCYTMLVTLQLTPSLFWIVRQWILASTPGGNRPSIFLSYALWLGHNVGQLMRGHEIAFHAPAPTSLLVSMPEILVPSPCDNTWSRIDFQFEFEVNPGQCFCSTS